MICTSISEKSLERIFKAIQKTKIAEIRLDLCQLTTNEIQKLFGFGHKLIASYRPGEIADEQRATILKNAIEAGASYVDIEVESNTSYKNDLVKTAQKYDCQVIISHHDYAKTPSLDKLHKIVKACQNDGADIVKIACQINNIPDATRLISLYDDYKNIVALGMGEQGKITRLASLLYNAPFTFASVNKKSETAPGQIEFDSMVKIQKMLIN